MSEKTTPPPDAWNMATFLVCSHCERLHPARKATFNGGLYCNGCDEVSESPEEAVMRAQVLHARAAVERQHAEELQAERNLRQSCEDMAQMEIERLQAEHAAEVEALKAQIAALKARA